MRNNKLYISHEFHYKLYKSLVKREVFLKR
jgi:hypothetical protein